MFEKIESQYETMPEQSEETIAWLTRNIGWRLGDLRIGIMIEPRHQENKFYGYEKGMDGLLHYVLKGTKPHTRGVNISTRFTVGHAEIGKSVSGFLRPRAVIDSLETLGIDTTEVKRMYRMNGWEEFLP